LRAAEVTISLSNVIKAFGYIPLDGKKRIQAPIAERPPAAASRTNGDTGAAEARIKEQAIREAEEIKTKLIQDAEAFAESVIEQASKEAENLLNAARQEIDSWWNSKRQEADQAMADAREQGREEGYREGLKLAEADMQKQYEQKLAEARQLIESAHQIKQRIIREAEPFLIELSSAIAEKIVNHELSLHPEWHADLIKKALLRRKGQGTITLCVSPEQFRFVQDARDELLIAIDSQAELQIIPDPSVRSCGCVIRSSFGSIDATVDTQMEEIKKELLQIALSDEGDAEHG
jgi:flagellar assembly protein FliH